MVFQYRLGRLNAGGGWNIGNSIQTGVAAGGNVSNSNESCFVVDTPQDLFNCKVNNPYQSRVKLNGACRIPWQDIQLALVYQNNPGPGYTTNITYGNAQISPSLGRALSVGASADHPGGGAEHAVRSRGFRSSISAAARSSGCRAAAASR